MSAPLCPVCRQESASPRCPCCGSDQSRYYERRPTLALLPAKKPLPVSALRAAFLEASTPEPEAPDPAKLFQRALQAPGSGEQLELLSQASFLGYAPAQAVLGERYLQQGKAELAVTLFRKAAQQGNPNACYLLHCCYRDGTGVQRSSQFALTWLRRAVSFGHIRASLEYADLLLVGKELPRDPDKAEELYRRAALAGVPDGLIHLAKCYRDGAFVSPSPDKAAQLLQDAKKLGSKDAALLLEDLRAPKTSASKETPPGTSAAKETAPKSASAGAGQKPGAEDDPRRYARGRAYESGRYEQPKAAPGSNSSAKSGQSRSGAARASASPPKAAADGEDRRYAHGRSYEQDRYEKTPAAGAKAARPVNSSPAAASSGAGAQTSAGSKAPPQAPAAAQPPASGLESKSLRQLKFRRGLDIFLIIYVAMGGFGLFSLDVSEMILPGIMIALVLWLLIRRYRKVTKAYRAKLAVEGSSKP